MRRLWIFIGAILPLSIWAQTYDAVGTIIDGDRHEPLANVEIFAKTGQKLGVSNEKGRFQITANSRHAILVFKKVTFKEVELDLGELPDLIDIEVSLESSVQELAEKIVRGKLQTNVSPYTKQSIEELEMYGGMKIDLNDHLRQLPGVSGMTEFSNDISVYGGRTADATHYLGQSRLPSLRHLDIGLPGNQSVINPRLLKSISLEDNLARGPLQQGNSSALVYDLKEGDPDYIRGDIIFGTINRELNLNGYWDGRTYMISGRYLEPTFLSNLGSKFYTQPKEARLNKSVEICKSKSECPEIEDPIHTESGDLLVSTFYKDSTGASSRWSFLGVRDSFDIKQDIADSKAKSTVQHLNEGGQVAGLFSYESNTPYTTGDYQNSFGYLYRSKLDVERDSLPPAIDNATSRPWYLHQPENKLGNTSSEEYKYFAAFQWNSNQKLFGAQYGYGGETEYGIERRAFLTTSTNGIDRNDGAARENYWGTQSMLRLKWNLESKSNIESSFGLYFLADNIGQGKGVTWKVPAPVASMRYNREILDGQKAYTEIALRQNADVQPVGVDNIAAVTTSSIESKIGLHGNMGSQLNYSSSVYARAYQKPTLPIPEVYWNYAEIQKADYALVPGANVTVAWNPSHHMGLNMNGSVVQGDYYLSDGNALPWEANRTLDLVSNLRVLPRNDSLFSFILTYTVNNDVPLYEYTGLWNAQAGKNGLPTLTRHVQASSEYPTVSRARTDMRVNIDLKSKWKPLESMRFFFEVDNIFGNIDSPNFAWLGGDNKKRRSWTRANSQGDLDPMVNRGLGFFIMFGFEGKLMI